MDNNILSSVKKELGVSVEDTAFDEALIMDINLTFMVLNQLGVGPAEGFTLQTGNENWTDFMPAGQILEGLKTYVYIKVKLMFDPPASATILESYQRQINEFEWRLNVASDPV